MLKYLKLKTITLIIFCHFVFGCDGESQPSQEVSSEMGVGDTRNMRETTPSPDMALDSEIRDNLDLHREEDSFPPIDMELPDEIAPRVFFTNPLEGQTVEGDVTIEVTAEDDRGSISQVNLYVNGEEVASLNGESYSWTSYVGP